MVIVVKIFYIVQEDAGTWWCGGFGIVVVVGCEWIIQKIRREKKKKRFDEKCSNVMLFFTNFLPFMSDCRLKEKVKEKNESIYISF